MRCLADLEDGKKKNESKKEKKKKKIHMSLVRTMHYIPCYGSLSFVVADANCIRFVTLLIKPSTPYLRIYYITSSIGYYVRTVILLYKIICAQTFLHRLMHGTRSLVVLYF
jgi:hypothetical protein